jgi:hypothetical protein
VVHKNVIKGGVGLLYDLSTKRDDFLNIETVFLTTPILVLGLGFVLGKVLKKMIL